MSDKKEPNPELVFHYSREERLQKASSAVKRLYDPSYGTRVGLFRSLTANRSLAFLFLAIIMLSATALVTSIFIPSADRAEFAGNEITIEAFSFENALYLTVQKKKLADNARDGVLAFSVKELRPDPERGVLLNATAMLGKNDRETFKYRMDASSERIEVLLLFEGRTARLSADVR